MNVDDVPVVGRLRAVGADDPLFDLLLALGPLLVVGIGVLGRSPATLALAVAYLLAFAGGIGYEAATGR